MPDAVICANNYIAYGCVNALHDRNIQIPKDVGILMFDDYPFSKILKPMLTVVNATTNYGENIYIVGNVPELGSWNVDECTEAMLNPGYPEWYLPVSVPANTTIEFKFIKKDASGNVMWESGGNRVIASSGEKSGVIDTEVYIWR